MSKNERLYYVLYPIVLAIAFFTIPELLLNFSYLNLVAVPEELYNVRSIIRHVALILWFSASLLLAVLWIDFWLWIWGKSGRNASKPPFLNWITRAILGK